MCCVARAVDKYVQATKAFRKTDQLLVCFAGPRKSLAASKMTIARWVRTAIIKEAYISLGRVPPTGVKSHSTRALAASWAQFNNISLVDICKSATWASGCTFATFYIKLNLANSHTS